MQDMKIKFSQAVQIPDANGFFPDAEDKSIKALRFKRKGNVITCLIKKAGSNTWEAYSSTLMADWTDSIKKRLEGLK